LTDGTEPTRADAAADDEAATFTLADAARGEGAALANVERSFICRGDGEGMGGTSMAESSSASSPGDSMTGTIIEPATVSGGGGEGELAGEVEVSDARDVLAFEPKYDSSAVLMDRLNSGDAASGSIMDDAAGVADDVIAMLFAFCLVVTFGPIVMASVLMEVLGLPLAGVFRAIIAAASELEINRSFGRLPRRRPVWVEGEDEDEALDIRLLTSCANRNA